MKNIVCYLSLLLIFSISATAQETMTSLRLSGGLPVDEFRSEVGGQVFPSLNLGILRQLGKSPIYVGGEIGFMLYGTAMHRSNQVINGTRQSFRIRRNNNAIFLAGVVRVMPDLGIAIRPFIEGQSGAVFAYTRSKVRENLLAEPMASGMEVYDFSHLLQVGGGLMIPLEKEGDILLELRVDYMKTGAMDFLTRADASYDDQGTVTLSTRNAAFQLLSPGIALKIRF